MNEPAASTSDRRAHQPQLPAHLKQQNGKRLKKPREKRPNAGLTRKVRAACDLIIWEGLGRAEAAERAGLADRSLLAAFNKPAVLRYLREQEDVLRAGERPRNIHTGIRLRDEADSEKVQLDAAKWLHGEAVGAQTQVNVGITNNVMPGYVIRVPVDHQPTQQADMDAKPLIEQDERSDA